MDARAWTRRSVAALVAALALGVGVAAAQGAPDAAAPSQTMLIFDGSGSMWGKLEGDKQTKLVEARDAVRAALAKASPSTMNVGLMSFGHRRQADCSDVQVIAPPDAAVLPAFADRITTPLERLNPKGKGPLTAALKEAAKALAKAPGARSIVLVHDDPDNCQQDACAALAEIQQSAPGVVVHVVGLGLKPEDAARYQCLTKPTGGRHVDVQTGAQLAAQLADVLVLAMQGGRAADEPRTPAAAPREVQAAPTPLAALDVAKSGPPALRVRAALIGGVAIAGHRVRWTIWPAGGSDAAPAATVDGSDVRIPLASQVYRIRAAAGLLQGEVTATLAAEGETPVEVVLDGGEIRLRSPLPADAALRLAGSPGATGPLSQPPALWPHGQVALLVPPGPMTLHYEQGELRTKRPIEVLAGKTLVVDVAEPGGRVLLDLLSRAGPPVAAVAAEQPVVYAIAEDDPDAPLGRREIGRSAARTAEFVVQPGTYIVSATRGAMTVRERISVAAGDTVRRSLPLIAARVVIGARLSARASEPSGTPAEGQSEVFQVIRLDVPADERVVLAGPAAIVDVPPGRYRITARRNPAAIDAQQEIEVKAGDFKAVTLDYHAGGLRMAAVLPPEAIGHQMAWHLLDAGGHLVWSSYEAAPAAMLAAGRYTLRLSMRGARREQAIEIRDGEITSIEMRQP